MRSTNLFGLQPLFLIATTLLLLGCGGGGGGGTTTEPPAPPPPPPPPPPTALTEAEATRFLSQATFGPNRAAVSELVSFGLEDWLLNAFEKPASLYLDTVLAGFPADGKFLDERGMPLPEVVFLASDAFWKTAIEADDQLRQRMAYALSQILVASSDSDIGRAPQMMAHYMDVMTEGAFGNYRDLLQKVTYSPAMAVYLTYLRNEKADARTGRVPDENYARELMQLFTIGLVELEPDGSPIEGPDGSQVELYDNADITELAKVFTGLSFQGAAFDARLQLLPLPAFYTPLVMFDEFHSVQSKNFLGTNIPANTGGEESIELALDAIFAHPNLAPFVGRQLIQRFVTSAPTPQYVQRVSAAFDNGDYELPSGTTVGSGERGDLQAVIAAILFDAEARGAASIQNPQFGKLREPVLRFTHWARAFEVNSADASNELALRNTNSLELLGQHPYRAPHVFNFYRPGYIAPGTETGAAKLTAPELQISNASSVVGYPNFMSMYAFGLSPKRISGQPAAYVADYAEQAALATDPDALLDNLDGLLTHGTLEAETRERITQVLDGLDADTEEDLQTRTQVAIVMVMTSPEYIVLR